MTARLAAEVDAVVVGAGPNGRAAAVTLARAGLRLAVFVRSRRIGGGAATAELTLQGFHHDVCAAVHPLAFESQFFRAFGLRDRVRFTTPEGAAGTVHVGGTRPEMVAAENEVNPRSLARASLRADGPGVAVRQLEGARRKAHAVGSHACAGGKRQRSARRRDAADRTVLAGLPRHDPRRQLAHGRRCRASQPQLPQRRYRGRGADPRAAPAPPCSEPRAVAHAGAGCLPGFGIRGPGPRGARPRGLARRVERAPARVRHPDRAGSVAGA